jgi:hypothetical protein
MASEVGRCEILFFYWLAKINVMKKFDKMLRCPQSQSLEDLSANLSTKLALFPHFLQF